MLCLFELCTGQISNVHKEYNKATFQINDCFKNFTHEPIVLFFEPNIFIKKILRKSCLLFHSF